MSSLFSLFLLLFALIASTQTDKPSCCLSFCLEIYTIFLFGTVYFLIHFFVCFYLFPVYAELFLSFIFKNMYLSFIANHLPFSVFYYFVCSSFLSFIFNIWLSYFLSFHSSFFFILEQWKSFAMLMTRVRHALGDKKGKGVGVGRKICWAEPRFHCTIQT